jgi:dipeptidyl aminopeptidase/acylaminoacyl peptidase
MRCVASILLCALPCCPTSADLRPYTVTDSIALQRVLLPAEVAQESIEEYALAPDGHSALVVLYRGLLDRGLTEYTLARFDAAEAREFMSQPQRTILPRYETLIRFRTNGLNSASFQAASAHGIEALHWIAGGRQLLFIGRGQHTGEIGQIFRYDLASATLTQLTQHPYDIQSFQYVESAEMLLYIAQTPPDWRRRNRLGFVVDGQLISDLLTDDPHPRAVYSEMHNYALNLRTKTTTHIEFTDPGKWTQTLVSPSGRWALIIASLESLPSHWLEYPELESRLRHYLGPKVSFSRSSKSGSETLDSVYGTSLPPWIVRQIQLVDLATGHSRMLLDAPAQEGGLQGDKVAWSPDGDSLLLARSFLSLVGAEGDERERRRQRTAVVEVELRSGRITEVAAGFEPWARAGEIARDTTIRSLPDGDALLLQDVTNSEGVVQLTRTLRLRKRRDGWHQMSEQSLAASGTAGAAAASASTLPPGSGIRHRWKMDTPTELEAFDAASGRQRIMTDLNPRMRAISAASRTEVMEFDRHGQLHKGGLYYPRGYRPGTRYPLVIQTYGFSEPTPFDDGIQAGVAAHPLAARGLMVFQAPCSDATESPEALRQYGENGSQQQCYEAVVDFLDGRGLIDRNRVGLIGFSRSGMHVHYAATFSNLPFAAALISDSMQATPWNYAISYGSPASMRQWDDPMAGHQGWMIGAPLFGDGIQRWLERSPAFNLHRLRTPLRYEHHGLGVPPGPWDTFAILKRMKRPVELVHIPRDGHDLANPLSRYTSQQGSVDWFDFWLTGAEDPDPSKAGQYRTWREMRRQQQAHLAQEWEQANATVPNSATR